MTVRKQDYEGFVWTPPKAGFLCVYDTLGGEVVDGVFFHRSGIVDIYQQGDDRFSHITYLRLIGPDGRCHERKWKRRWGKRTLPSLCRQFLQDVHGATTEQAGKF